MSKPKKWTEVYPQGTKEGDEERKFFIALGRNPQFDWRSVAAIAKEAGLSKTRVEEIIAKYHKKGMVLQSAKNDEHWAYWERVPQSVPATVQSIVKDDQDQRIAKAMGKKKP
jgi:hypothetical protein